MTDEEKIKVVIELAQQNVNHDTGGPFGAAIFNEDGKIVSIGVNAVIPNNCSIAHAEIMTIITAQQQEERNRLNSNGKKYTLASSAQPCSMCFGAMVWAGINRLLCGATREDVENIAGFSEGPIPENWKDKLAQENIEVVTEICRDQAIKPLQQYKETNKPLY